MARMTLENWLTQALNDPDKLDETGQVAPLSMLVLMHMQGTAEKEIHSVKFHSGKDYNIKSLAEMFRNKVSTDAQELPGHQQYVIYAFYGSDQWKSRYPIGHTGEGGLEYKGLSTEGPDKTGQTMQGMRLTEAIVQGTFRMQGQLWAASQQMIANLSTQLDREQNDKMQLLDFVVKQQMEKAQQDHEMRMKEMEYKRSSEERRMLMQLAPALANTITGKEVFPQSTADTALIKTIVAGLKKNPSNLKTLMQLDLPAEVMAPLMSRINQELEEDKAGEERLGKLTEGMNGTNEFGSDDGSPH